VLGVEPAATQFYCPYNALSPVDILKWSIYLGLEIEYAATNLAGRTIKPVCKPLHFVVANGNDVAFLGLWFSQYGTAENPGVTQQYRPFTAFSKNESGIHAAKIDRKWPDTTSLFL
jgi:hypothetical protein